MAKVKVVNNNLDQNLNGNYFNSTPSQTIFQFGSFAVTSNFDGRKYIDYTNTLSSFVRAVTLDNMGIDTTQSQILHEYATNVVLNLDKSDLNTFIRFGSAYEFLRISIEKIITTYPYGLFVNSQMSRGGNTTFQNFSYDIVTNTSKFEIFANTIVNTYGLAYNQGNVGSPNDIQLRNLNLSYQKYIVWNPTNPSGNSCNVIGFTGYSTSNPVKVVTIQTMGNPFPTLTGTTAEIDFHIKPNNFIFEEFRALLSDYEKYIVSTRAADNSGFEFTINEPILLDDGNVTYSNIMLLWSTSDGYNLNISTSGYQNFLEILLTVGAKYDKVKTDLIARFLTPASLKAHDLTEEGKMTKLLRIYGAEFDQIREFIDSIVYINRVTYPKINNIPDQLIKNLSRTFGWDYFSLVNEQELVSSFLTIDENERNLNTDLLPAEIDIELWRRILINTNYFWKSKGTREAIKSMFLLIGIPEPFINITEYVYTVDGKINPNTVPFVAVDFPNESLPYDNSGYPVAPLETADFYFQISGNTDSGQAYMDNFRKAGFDLNRTIDNKKSWVEAGGTFRIDDTTPQYYQEDSKLVINTKEVDVALDTARGIEFDVYEYVLKDFAVNSSGYTMPYSYVNISLGVAASQTTFPLPVGYTSDKVRGDLEVRFNGILLNAPKSGLTTGYTTNADYSINEVNKTFTLTGQTGAMYAQNNSRRRDVIQATFVYSGGTHSMSGVTVDYVVTRVNANINGTAIPLPSMPRGDVQVTINGISLTKGTPQFAADYIVDPNNTTGSSQIIIQNAEVIAYLRSNPMIQVAYVEVVGSNDIAARSEIVRVDSFNSGKVYFNQSANKYVYKMNYKANSATDIKVLIDGIALEPNMDYSINVQNLYEIFLPRGVRYGSIISVYYLVGGNAVFTPVVNDIFGVGDISQLSFLEFMELIQRKMINARNRKTISDFKGGWYPSLERIYAEYMRRSLLENGDPLQSNGYTFANLYPFLSKYNAFFQHFIDQLLPATIILRKSGLLVRNSIFTKQKFMYRRGVNLYSGGSTIYDSRGRFIVEYLGNDGSMFLINQQIPAPVAPTLFVNTIIGSNGSIVTGGDSIIGKDILTSYGMIYRELNGTWKTISNIGSLAQPEFATTISDVVPDTTYEYAAFVRSTVYGYTGQTRQITTPVAPIIPYVETIQGTSDVYSISNTGGFDIVGYDSTDYYGMQYKEVSSGTWITAPLISGIIPANYYSFNITGLTPSTSYNYRAYLVIFGQPYYGNTWTNNTLTIPAAVPVVTTGNADNIQLESMSIINNTVIGKGVPATISEYGVLYSQNPSTNLTYDEIGAKKISIFSGGTTVPFNFDDSLTPLLQNTITYYRAFAKNATGVGYGAIYTEQTLAPIQKGVYLSGQYVTETDGKVLASAKLSVDSFSSGSFRLYFTDSACSLGSSVRPMCACSYYIVGASPTKNVCASTLVPDLTSPTQIVNLTGYIDVTPSNINNYTFYTMACSHTANFTADYTNCAVVQLGAIVNEVGGSYYLPDLTLSCMSVHTTSASCPAGGHIPVIT